MNTETKKWYLVFGAGGIYVANPGQTFTGTLRKCRSLWLEKFRDSVSRQGMDSVMAAWFESDLLEGTSWITVVREARANESSFEIQIDVSVLPQSAVDIFGNIETEELSSISWKLSLRARKRTMRDKDKGKAQHDKVRKEEIGRKLIDMMFEVKPSTIIERGVGIENLWVGGEIEWEINGEELMERAWKGIDMWPFIGLDCEGGGIWYQISWYGENGVEVVILGPSFFPSEMMELLEAKSNYVLGKNVHDELKFILDSKSGWNGIDLAVLTRDLKKSDHLHNSLGAMIGSATGQSFDKIKNPKKYDHRDRMKFGYIRALNWDRKLDGLQYTYAAFDVIAPHIIMYDYMCELVYIEELESRFKSFKDYLHHFLNKLVDRELNPKKAHVMYAVPLDERDPRTGYAALDLSEEIEENLDGLGMEMPEERRVRMMETIKLNGEEKWRSAKKIWVKNGKQKLPPQWMRHPDLRDDSGRMNKIMKLQ